MHGQLCAPRSARYLCVHAAVHLVPHQKAVIRVLSDDLAQAGMRDAQQGASARAGKPIVIVALPPEDVDA